MGKGKPRHRPDDSRNQKVGMYSGTEEWSCRWFDGSMCEHLLLWKDQLTSCRGIHHNCLKQIIRNDRHNDRMASRKARLNRDLVPPTETRGAA